MAMCTLNEVKGMNVNMENIKLEKLTNSQEVILDSLKRFMAINGYPPTVRELCEINNLSSSATIQLHLEKLQEKGYINKKDAKSRTLELLVPNEYDKDNRKVIKVPFYKMGLKNNIEDIPNHYVDILSSLVNIKKDIFVLKVKGNEMNGAGIFDKDLIIVERTDKVYNGSVVVAFNEYNEIVIRYFNKENDYIKLVATDDFVKPSIMKEAKIFGKVVGVYHKF